MTHICVSELTIIGSDIGLSPGRCQAIRTLATNIIEILSENHTFSFKKMHLKMSSEKCRPFCFGLNVLNQLKPNYTIWRDRALSILLKLMAYTWQHQAIICTSVESSAGSCATHLKAIEPWWRHQMETVSAILAISAWNSPVPGEFPA